MDGFRNMATDWVSEEMPLPLDGWVNEWVYEAWLLDGFLRHGHSVGFGGMATRWVSEALPLNGFLRHGHWLDL